MALHTKNYYGDINISDDAVSMLVSRVASECYGVFDLAPYRLSDSILLLFNKTPLSKGVKIVTIGSKIFIDIYVILKSSVNREAVLESLRSAVVYHAEYTTGMRVKSVNIHVVGTRL